MTVKKGTEMPACLALKTVEGAGSQRRQAASRSQKRQRKDFPMELGKLCVLCTLLFQPHESGVGLLTDWTVRPYLCVFRFLRLRSSVRAAIEN